MPNGFGDINTPYNPIGGPYDINKKYTGPTPIQGQGRIPAIPNISDEIMDEGYEPQESQTSSSQEGMFSDVLGAGVDIYDSQSIASSLMSKYDLEGLTPGMFPAMSKELMAGTQASTYDLYKRMMINPKAIDLRKMISSSAGMLNPNKKRERAMSMFKAGMGDIRSNIFDKTSAARTGVRDWLNNALAKVKRMRY